MRKISQDTLIPLSMVGTIIGGVVWLSSVAANTELGIDRIDRVEKANNEWKDYIIDQLKIINEKIDRLSLK